MERYSLNHLFRTLGCFLLCVMFTATAFAQQKTIKGTVVDVTGEPLIGVNVAVKGTTIGIITDIDGNYTLEVPSKSTIVFSYIGYQAQEVPVGNQSTINVTLKEDAQKLEEVVVVGYGTQKKVTVTGSVASVSGEELKASPTTNLSNGMVGRMPGVIGFQKSDEPGGGGTTIRVRGTNSLGSNDPLVVIDGIPDRDGGFNRLNPTEIESISVLKDASAAIYGARAANGVILITTKRGKEGKATVTFNASGGFSQPTRLPKMANAFEYATMVNEINPGTWTDEDLRLFQDGSDPWGHPDTDWFDTTIKNASPMYRADVGVQGGSEKMKYYVNFAANGEDGIYKNSANRYDQYSLRMNLDINTSKYVSFQLGSIARLENTKYPMKSASSIFSGIRRGKPTQNAYWPTGEPGPDLERGDNPAVTSTDIAGFDNQKNYYIQNNLSVNIKIPWIEGLTIRGNGSYDKHFYNRKKFEKPILLYSWDGVNKNSSGLTAAKRYVDNAQLSREHSDATSWMVNGLIDYNRTFGQHNLGVTFGIEAQKKDYDFTSAFRQGFISDTKPELNLGSDVGMKNTGYSWEEARLNYFGRVSYNYLERYLFEFVWRADGSYRFPKNKRYGFFPGASVAWRVSEENWWKENVRFIDYFKLRASISQTGNDALLNSDNEYDRSIQYLNTYGFTEHGVVFGGEESKRLYAVRTPNPNITWEVGTTYNVGLDFKFLQNRLSVETDAFYHKRTNMLISRNASLSEITGITLPRENIGEMKNRGFDMLVGWNDNIGDVQYNVSLNATYARNKILFWDETPGAPAWQVSTGLPVSTSLYYVADGIFHNQAELDSYPHFDTTTIGDFRFVDANGNGILEKDADRVIVGNYMPDFYYGFSVNLSYKGFDLAANFQGVYGNEILNLERRYLLNMEASSNMMKEPLQRYPYGELNRATRKSSGNNGACTSTFHLEDGSYLRLQNLSLGYTFPDRWTRKAGISKLRIYVQGTNLFTWTDYSGYNPEVNKRSTDALRPGEDYCSYPLSRTFSVGVNFNL